MRDRLVLAFVAVAMNDGIALVIRAPGTHASLTSCPVATRLGEHWAASVGCLLVITVDDDTLRGSNDHAVAAD